MYKSSDSREVIFTFHNFFSCVFVASLSIVDAAVAQNKNIVKYHSHCLSLYFIIF